MLDLKEVWPFCRTSSSVRLWWELEEPKVPKGRLPSLLRDSLASLVTFALVIALIFTPAAACSPAGVQQPPAALRRSWSVRGAVSAAGLVGSGTAGGAFRLARLSGGSGDDNPSDAATRNLSEGMVHFDAAEWEKAIASFTRGVECKSPQADDDVLLYYYRARAHAKQGSWAKATQDARLGLAVCDFCDNVLKSDSPTLLQLRPKFTEIALAAEMHMAMQEVLAEARSGTIVAPSTIDPTSVLGTALQEPTSILTAYFHEAQFRELHPGSKQRFLSTTNVMNGIAVLVSSSDGRAFGTHVNPDSLFSSLYENNVRGQKKGRIILENMSRALRRVFRDVDPSRVTISLVGGWKKMDLHPELRETYFPEEEAMWSFSAVVRRCVAEALPGASIDESRLNHCEGVEWREYTAKNQLRCTLQGQTFRVVALDSHTGEVETQTTDVTDCVPGSLAGSPGVRVPVSVTQGMTRHVTEMLGRVEKQIPGRGQRRSLSPIMTEYRD
ncbi:hypothetical protein T484DRAFT_1970166 [Baffinella frigidus]|nr:hypothetical protein T484DRAFT_1970166 [Cryptophyta sp. CCMP2293]